MNSNSPVTMEEAVQMTSRAERVLEPLKKYHESIANAIQNSDSLKQYADSSKSTNATLSDKIMNMANGVVSGVAKSDALSQIKNSLSSFSTNLFSSLWSGLTHLFSSDVVDEKVKSIKDDLQKAQQYLDEAKSANK